MQNQTVRVCSDRTKYNVLVEIKQREDCSFLSIEYKNVGDEVMYFQPEDPAVLVMNSSRKLLPFTGVIAKRPPYSIDEHVKLMPGNVLLREIALNSLYGLKKKGKYKVSVNADYFDPVQLKGYQKGSITKSFFYAGKCKQKTAQP